MATSGPKGQRRRAIASRPGLFNKKIKTRRYDDVLNDEYVEYQYYEQVRVPPPRVRPAAFQDLDAAVYSLSLIHI